MNITPIEYQECVALAQYLDILQTQKKILRYTHIPNETFTKSWNQKMKNKRQGVHPGIPDYIILFPRLLVFLEMKRIKGSSVSVDQMAWITDLSSLGFIATVCYGFEHARAIIEDILKMDKS